MTPPANDRWSVAISMSTSCSFSLLRFLGSRKNKTSELAPLSALARYIYEGKKGILCRLFWMVSRPCVTALYSRGIGGNVAKIPRTPKHSLRVANVDEIMPHCAMNMAVLWAPTCIHNSPLPLSPCLGGNCCAVECGSNLIGSSAQRMMN